MPRRLHRYYGSEHFHFITSSCYHQRPLLGTAARRNLFLKILEEARLHYGFIVVGYVIMPEHIHLLISEAPCWSRERPHFSKTARSARHPKVLVWFGDML